MKLPKGTIKRIHVNQQLIRMNSKNGSRYPVITVKTSKTNHYASEVEINGPSKLVYSPDDPLSCGAKLWIETRAEVEGEFVKPPNLRT